MSVFASEGYKVVVNPLCESYLTVSTTTLNINLHLHLHIYRVRYLHRHFVYLNVRLESVSPAKPSRCVLEKNPLR